MVKTKLVISIIRILLSNLDKVCTIEGYIKSQTFNLQSESNNYFLNIEKVKKASIIHLLLLAGVTALAALLARGTTGVLGSMPTSRSLCAVSSAVVVSTSGCSGSTGSPPVPSAVVGKLLSWLASFASGSTL